MPFNALKPSCAMPRQIRLATHSTRRDSALLHGDPSLGSAPQRISMDEHEREHEWTAELVSCTFRTHLMDLHVRRAAVSALLSAGSEDIVPCEPGRCHGLDVDLAVQLVVMAVGVTYKSAEVCAFS